MKSNSHSESFRKRRAAFTCSSSENHLQKEKQNLEDAGDELLMLDDDTELIPYPFKILDPFKWMITFLRTQ